MDAKQVIHKIEKGDVIVKSYKQPPREVRYAVLRYTSHGKVLLQLPSGNTMSAWWRREDQLPKSYRLEKSEASHGQSNS